MSRMSRRVWVTAVTQHSSICSALVRTCPAHTTIHADPGRHRPEQHTAQGLRGAPVERGGGPGRVFLEGCAGVGIGGWVQGGSVGGAVGGPPPPSAGDPELLEAPKKFFGLN